MLDAGCWMLERKVRDVDVEKLDQEQGPG